MEGKRRRTQLIARLYGQGLLPGSAWDALGSRLLEDPYAGSNLACAAELLVKSGPRLSDSGACHYGSLLNLLRECRLFSSV